MISELTKTEHSIVSHAHLEVINEQTKLFSKYMRDRFFTGDFPNSEELVSIINVVESVYEETMEMDRSIVASSDYDEVYEYILLKKNRFGRENQYVKTRVYPIIYHPVPGDIVTLPIHLLMKAAESDTRLLSPINWEMRVVAMNNEAPYSFEWKNPNPEKTPLIPSKVRARASCPVVTGVHEETPFTFPPIGINHYIILHPAKEEL